MQEVFHVCNILADSDFESTRNELSEMIIALNINSSPRD